MPNEVGPLKDFRDRLNDITEPGKKRLNLPPAKSAPNPSEMGGFVILSLS
jgi:hypothetical protein